GLGKGWGLGDKIGQLSSNLQRSLLKRIGDEALADDDRIAAAKDLTQLEADDAAVTTLLEQLSPKASPNLTRGMLDALGQCGSDKVGATLVQRWRELTPTTRPLVLNILLRRPAWTKALLSGLEKGQIDRADLNVEQAQLLAKHPDAELAAQAAKILSSGGRLPNPDRQKVLDAFLDVAKRHGDK